MISRRTAVIAIVGILLAGYGVAAGQERSAPPVSCERSYRERILAAQTRQDAELPELNAIKARGERMTDSAAYGRWLVASSEVSRLRESMRLACD